MKTVSQQKKHPYLIFITKAYINAKDLNNKRIFYENGAFRTPLFNLA